MLYHFKCKRCNFVETLDNDTPSFVGAGIQCEEFFEHLREQHNLEEKLIGHALASEILSDNPDIRPEPFISPDGFHSMPVVGGIILDAEFEWIS